MLQSTNLEDYVYIQVNHLTNIFKLGARESTVTYVIKKLTYTILEQAG